MNLSLKNLKLDYVDLYLIHFPVGLVGQHDTDFLPMDENGMVIMDKNPNLVALWKVI